MSFLSKRVRRNPIWGFVCLSITGILAPVGLVCSQRGSPPATETRAPTDIDVSDSTSDSTRNLPDDSLATAGGEQPRYAYDFWSPDAEFKLDEDLKEISGLTLFDDSHLAAIEDERGHFYLIDFTTGATTEEHRFAGKGDYEGIERAHERLFALRSDGQVREIVDFDTDDPDSDKVKTPLGSGCDAEGLAFDPLHERLLISCKEHPGNGLKGVRAIYALELESLTMSETPVFIIPVDTIDAVGGAPGNVISKFITPLVDFGGFKPSALAIHPCTDDLFVLSSVLKVIVVLNQSGDIVEIFPLDRDMLEQPEGLAFLQNGDLFISSEGHRRKPRLFRFNSRLPADSREP